MLPEEIAKEEKAGDLYINPENLGDDTPSDATKPAEEKKEDAAPVAKADDKTPAAEKEKPKEEPKAKRNGAQDRIDELTKARRIAERRAELAESKLAEIEKAGNPDPDKFEDAADHAAAVARAEGRKSAYATQKEEATAEIENVDKETQDLLIEDWTEAVEDAKKALPDFEEVLSKSKSPLPSHVERAILESGAMGPKIAYHLAKNTAEAIHLSRLSPMALGRELARLEIRLQSQPAPETKVVTKAPAPIEPITAQKSAHADTDDFEAWKAKRNKERNYR